MVVVNPTNPPEQEDPTDGYTPFYLEDRSGAELDDKCGMAYWWNRLYGKRGIVAVEEAFYFQIGRETHEDLQTIADLEDISAGNIDSLVREITNPITEADRVVQSRMEPLYRRLGWLAAFALFIEPKIRKTYETVGTEAELILDRDPLWVPVTPDRLLRHREDGYFVYKEYKTALSAGPKWMNGWQFKPQPHIGLKAIEEEVGVKPAFCQIVGLMKGDERGNRLSHPYVWGWKNNITGEWTHDYDKARSAQWEPAPVWEYPGGVVEWVIKAGPEVAVSQFPHSAPVFLNERLLANWVMRRSARQVQISEILDECRHDEELRIINFEPRTDQCRPQFGAPCQYLAACHNAQINQNPLASGLYKERIPHHEVEITIGSVR